MANQLRKMARQFGSDDSMFATYQTMFDNITDSDVTDLISAFRSGNQNEYKVKLSEAKQKYQYNDLQLLFTDGLPEWT